MRALNRLLCTVLLVMCTAPAAAHVGRHIPVIVDTDVALDDIRALALLTQSEDVRLLLVVTSDGACGPRVGAQNADRMLRALGRPSVPVAPGRILHLPPPPWRAMSESLAWPELETASSDSATSPAEQWGDSQTNPVAAALIVQTLRAVEPGVIYICLGPLTNLAAALTADPSIEERIAVLYYEGTPPEAVPGSWNTSRDSLSAVAVFESAVPIVPVRVMEQDLLTFDTGLLEIACSSSTPAAQLVCRVHSGDRVRRLVESGHFRCWDEMVVLRFLFPGLFSSPASTDRTAGDACVRCDHDAARLTYVNLLSGDLSVESRRRSSVVLEEYPTDSIFLRSDVQALAPAIIARHGLEEWNAALLTNELHRHLGIYSLLGAKMGIRAREILGAGLDDLRVISLAGSEPPLSCLTDGLQVATGATLGRGTIEVERDGCEPVAVFLMDSRRLTLRIRDGIVAGVRSDIRRLIEQHGSLTPSYWTAVRELALRYWLEMDRNTIFEETLED